MNRQVIALKHILSDFDLSKEDLKEILDLSSKIKENPLEYGESIRGRP
jgi:ornithine carbamoyltransferase